MTGHYFEKFSIKALIFLFLISANYSAQQDSLSQQKYPDQTGRKNVDKRVSEVESEEEEYISLEGKIIKKIIIDPLDVAGKSIYNGSDEDPGWFGRLSNSLHYKTREWVIGNRLLFNEGDSIVSKYISESERLLRSSGYFIDARILIDRENLDNDSVDVIVITKDRWTLTPLISYSTEQKNGYLGLKDDNFLGLGHKIETTITFDQNISVGWGGNFQYIAANVAGTYTDIGAKLETNKRFNMQGLSFSRPFITTETEWAGGLDFSWENGIFEFRNNSGMQAFPYSRSFQDIWVGRSFPVWFGSDLFINKSRIVTAVRVGRTNHTSRPDVTAFSNRIFENRTIYLFSLGLINRRFYKDFYIKNFGITEDVPIGGIISFTGGSESSEFNNRWYAAVEAIYSRRIQGVGYLSASIGLSGFRNINRWEQNIFDLNFIYHSPLIVKGEWKYRLFLENDYLFGFNLFTGEQIYLDIENGLRGFENLAVHGTKRTTLNLEARIFSPFSPLGFSIGGILFADFGLIAEKNVNAFNSRLYQSYGAGLRTRNESIARTDFEIALVYNPYNPLINGGSVKILFTSTIVLGFRDFGFIRPAVIPYGNLR